MFSKSLRTYIKCFLFISLIWLLFYVMCFNVAKDKKSHKYKNTVPQVTSTILKSNSVESKLEKQESTAEAKQLFFVNTTRCRMPYVEPFTPELLAIYKPPKFETCTNEPDLVTPVFDIKLKRYILHINETLARKLMKSSTGKYNCSYEEVIHSGKDDSYAKPMKKKYFTHGYVVPLNVEGIIVECFEASKTSHKLQKDAFFLVQHKVPDTVKPQPASNQTIFNDTSTLRKPSVIMFGIDALSRINLRRTMPKVYEHLNHRGWYELQGYNKVADNTLPNLMAILSGYMPESAKVICDISASGCFDRFPLIWKDFKNAGYLTAYAEDESGINPFNLLKPGFRQQPTDYYLRPFMKATEDNMRKYYKGMRYCNGRRIVSSYIYDFCHHYMQRFVDERPIFGLFWTNHFSHDNWDMPAAMCDKILQYLLDFETDGFMETTIMIFFADHGYRYSGLLNLPEGFLEERLPMMFIWLPPWFRKQYPEYAKALEINRNRLTSNYDLHITLKHIIKLGIPYELKSTQSAFDCPKCQSLFYPVPEDRTCADAGIIDHWCTCNPYRLITTENYARTIPHLVADRINEYLHAKELSSMCSQLAIRAIGQIELKLNLNENGEHIVQDVDTYRTKFKVNPKGAEFQATVLFNNRTKMVEVDVETISRLNLYKYDSMCIDDKEAKKYCICNGRKITKKKSLATKEDTMPPVLQVFLPFVFIFLIRL